MELGQIALLISLAGAVMAAATFWMNRGKEGAEAKATAEGAKSTAEDAKKISLDAHSKISALDAGFGLYREGMARELAQFLTRTELTEFEKRIMTALDKVVTKIDGVTGPIARTDQRMVDIERRIDRLEEHE